MMIQPYVRSATALALVMFFTGCLTIEEHYTFKKNGSGTMEYVVDMSELGQLMKSFGEMSEGDEGAMGGMGAMNLSAEVQTLEQIPGISKVKLNSRKEWVQRISFAFKDISALNAALNELMPDSTGGEHAFFSWEGSALVRTNNRHAYELGSSMAKDENGDGLGDEEGGLDMGAMLEAMKYRYSFKFAEDIVETSTADGVQRESTGRKEVRMNTDFSVIGRDARALDLRIVLDR